ncbi:probable ATP-dependent RNA helicase DDX27 isoform X2 [Bacillus rossius redtenbacheri]|uniref:probable ATP-dependent RNA helicase DDX27 isoform X2 n=1 Tax=Bacillus rossius redtenbacheri TaxID=93214 RepID=UPI002FDDBB34
MTNKSLDIVKTIDENDDVPDFSEDSDEEIEYQPSKKKTKKAIDFDSGFDFVSSVSEYNRDTWNDLAKYVKRRVKSKVDDKIQQFRNMTPNPDEDVETEEIVSVDGERKEVGTNQDGDEESDAEYSLSEDELKNDNVRIKETSIKRKKNKKISNELEDDNTNFFEDAPPPDPNANFYQMNLSRPLLKPTPIQAATVPLALLGRDVCGCAATGTGKTAAYMLPTLERLLYRPRDGSAVTRVLVLVPTRELGVQVYQVTRQLAQFTTVEVGLSVGGLDLKVQESVLRKNPDIVIATPGRLIDHLKNTPTFSLDKIEVLVLDEADRMLDEHFAEQMKAIVRECARSRQTMLFSATMTDEVRDLAAVSLSRPVRVFVDSNQVVAFNLRQEFVRIRPNCQSDREPLLAALVCRTFHDHVMVFVQTKKQAHRLHIMLGLMGVKVGELHGNLTQPQRLEALRKFKDEETDVLVATDVAARGLDIHGVKTVINFMMPATLEQYIHRVGRTARAGRSGVSVSLAGERERKVVKGVIKNSTSSVKCRVIPPDVLEKYRKRVQDLDEKVEAIMLEEYEERKLNWLEMKANKAQKLLNERREQQRPRAWFQTKKERLLEKAKFRLANEDDKGKNGACAKKMKKGKKEEDDDDDGDDDKPGKMEKGSKMKRRKRSPEEMAQDRAEAELTKIAQLQTRMAKRRSKPKKIRTVPDSGGGTGSSRQAGGGSQKRKKSSFSKDLTDVSLRGAKRMRFDANKKQKMDRMSKNKPGGGVGGKEFDGKKTAFRPPNPNRNFSGKKQRNRRK